MDNHQLNQVRSTYNLDTIFIIFRQNTTWKTPDHTPLYEEKINGCKLWKRRCGPLLLLKIMFSSDHIPRICGGNPKPDPRVISWKVKGSSAILHIPCWKCMLIRLMARLGALRFQIVTSAYHVVKECKELKHNCWQLSKIKQKAQLGTRRQEVGSGPFQLLVCRFIHVQLALQQIHWHVRATVPNASSVDHYEKGKTHHGCHGWWKPWSRHWRAVKVVDYRWSVDKKGLRVMPWYQQRFMGWGLASLKVICWCGLPCMLCLPHWASTDRQWRATRKSQHSVYQKVCLSLRACTAHFRGIRTKDPIEIVRHNYG